MHCSNEFILDLLSKLRSELNLSTGEFDSGGHSNAEEAWDAYINEFPSKIDELFYGMTQTSVACPNCGADDPSFEPFLGVPLECDEYDAEIGFRKFLDPASEDFEYDDVCEACGKEVVILVKRERQRGLKGLKDFLG